MPAMRGNEKVLEQLAEALKAELTAINQYFLHSKMCDNWGYFRLGGYYRQESIDEMMHAEKLMDRIIFLEGTPNMSDIGKINVGRNVKAQFENDLALARPTSPGISAIPIHDDRRTLPRADLRANSRRTHS